MDSSFHLEWKLFCIYNGNLYICLYLNAKCYDTKRLSTGDNPPTKGDAAN